MHKYKQLSFKHKHYLFFLRKTISFQRKKHHNHFRKWSWWFFGRIVMFFAKECRFCRLAIWLDTGYAALSPPRPLLPRSRPKTSIALSFCFLKRSKAALFLYKECRFYTPFKRKEQKESKKSFRTASPASRINPHRNPPYSPLGTATGTGRICLLYA